MAGQSNAMKALALLIAVIAMFSSSASAQEIGEMAPAPSPDQGGAAYSLPLSGAVVCSSLALSLLALLKH